MQNLNHRGIHCSSFCPLGDKVFESTVHALLHCDHVKLTWSFWHNCPIDLSYPYCDLVDVALDFLEKALQVILNFSLLLLGQSGGTAIKQSMRILALFLSKSGIWPVKSLLNTRQPAPFRFLLRPLLCPS